MPRSKTLSDREVLRIAHRLMHEAGLGPEGVTFYALSRASGLSPATLVQRFKTKAGMKRAALMQAWDELDEKTAALARSIPKTPAGAIEMLVALSGYGGIETYAEGLLVLREDFRDPVLRARGAAWKEALSSALEGCFVNAPGSHQGIGLLLATHWQGSLLWWGFDPKQAVEDYVRATLEQFVESLLPAQQA